jgi:hypothetical protein
MAQFDSISVQPPCPLCLCGDSLVGIYLPQMHRGHEGCTEKTEIRPYQEEG